jgi:hypothetical protein
MIKKDPLKKLRDKNKVLKITVDLLEEIIRDKEKEIYEMNAKLYVMQTRIDKPWLFKEIGEKK